MKEDKYKSPSDEDGEPHGVWEAYWNDHSYTGNYVHGVYEGLWVWCCDDTPTAKHYYII